MRVAPKKIDVARNSAIDAFQKEASFINHSAH
jgi:hypothetical protein